MKTWLASVCTFWLCSATVLAQTSSPAMLTSDDIAQLRASKLPILAPSALPSRYRQHHVRAWPSECQTIDGRRTCPGNFEIVYGDGKDDAISIFATNDVLQLTGGGGGDADPGAFAQTFETKILGRGIILNDPTNKNCLEIDALGPNNQRFPDFSYGGAGYQISVPCAMKKSDALQLVRSIHVVQ
jgi:hypothetical protein